jgi:hypothetical protein
MKFLFRPVCSLHQIPVLIANQSIRIISRHIQFIMDLEEENHQRKPPPKFSNYPKRRRKRVAARRMQTIQMEMDSRNNPLIRIFHRFSLFSQCLRSSMLQIYRSNIIRRLLRLNTKQQHIINIRFGIFGKYLICRKKNLIITFLKSLNSHQNLILSVKLVKTHH